MEGAVGCSECATRISSRLTVRNADPPLSDKFISFPHRHLTCLALFFPDRIVTKILCCEKLKRRVLSVMRWR